MTTDGFFSAVQHRDKPNMLLVRARSRADLEQLADRISINPSKILSTDNADYPYRVLLPKEQWAEYLLSATEDLTYPNFKSAVAKTNPERAYIYHDVWSALFEIEREGQDAKEKDKMFWWQEMESSS
jgi:hypothetical protein